jgi:hypothetical protein
VQQLRGQRALQPFEPFAVIRLTTGREFGLCSRGTQQPPAIGSRYTQAIDRVDPNAVAASQPRQDFPDDLLLTVLWTRQTQLGGRRGLRQALEKFRQTAAPPT